MKYLKLILLCLLLLTSFANAQAPGNMNIVGPSGAGPLVTTTVINNSVNTALTVKQDYIANLTALRAYGPASMPGAISTLGYTSAGDGGAATYQWNGSSTTADDGCITIKPTTYATGSWTVVIPDHGLSYRACGSPALATIASSATINLGVFGLYSITGTTSITTIGNGWIGRQVTIIPSAALPFGTGGNICNAFTATANVPVLASYTTCWTLK